MSIPSVSGIYCAGTGGIFLRHLMFSRYQWLIDLSIGIFLSLIMALLANTALTTLSLTQFNYDRQMMTSDATINVLIYLFLCRCLPFFLLILLTLRAEKRFFCHVYLIYVGFLYGVQSLLSAMAYGRNGWTVIFFHVFPQVLFYIPAFGLIWQLVGWVHGFSGRKQRLVVAVFLWILGTLAEWKINPYVMRLCGQWVL